MKSVSIICVLRWVIEEWIRLYRCSIITKIISLFKKSGEDGKVEWLVENDLKTLIKHLRFQDSNGCERQGFFGGGIVNGGGQQARNWWRNLSKGAGGHKECFEMVEEDDSFSRYGTVMVTEIRMKTLIKSQNIGKYKMLKTCYGTHVFRNFCINWSGSHSCEANLTTCLTRLLI